MRRLKTVRRPPIYPNGAQAISPVAPSPLFRCPHAVHRCPSVDSGLCNEGRPCPHRLNRNLSVKVLDFVKSGGPKWIVGGTIFEMWLGGL